MRGANVVKEITAQVGKDQSRLITVGCGCSSGDLYYVYEYPYMAQFHNQTLLRIDVRDGAAPKTKVYLTRAFHVRPCPATLLKVQRVTNPAIVQEHKFTGIA